MITKPYVRSSTAACVTLLASRDGRLVEITVAARAIDEAFQLTSSTEGDRQDVVEANLGEISKLVAAKSDAAADRTARIILDASDLERLSMRLTSDASARAAD